MPVLRHPEVDGQIDVDDAAARIYARSGWERADGQPLEADGSEPDGGTAEPGPVPQVSIYHPELDRHVQVPEESVSHYRRSGWLLSSEWQARQDAGADHDDEPPRRKGGRRHTHPDGSGGDGAGDQAGGEPDTTHPKQEAN